MTTLTDRYLNEVARHLPKASQDDVCDELHGLITDTLESRTLQSQDRQAAEHEVLCEMGEPSGLAANYTDRPLMLIGPRLYRRYINVLTVLLGTVLPLFVAGYAILEVTDGRDLFDIVLSSALVGLNLGAQLFTLVTVVFAILERTGRRAASQWTPADLPENPHPTDQAGRGKRSNLWLAVSLVAQIGLFVVILWQHRAAPYTLDNGDQVNILNPGLFSGWIWPILIGLAGVIILDVVRTSGRDWTSRLAAIYTLPQALFFLSLAWVFSQQLIFDQRFLTDFNSGWQTPDEFYTGIALILITWLALSTFDRFRLARRPLSRPQSHPMG